MPIYAAPEVLIPTPIASPLSPNSPQIDLWDSDIQVVELLKVIAKTFKVGVIIDEDVRGVLSYVGIPNKSAEEALEYVARNAGLQVRREIDGTYQISKKAKQASTLATAENLARYGFDLKVKLDKNKYKVGENIGTTATLSLDQNNPKVPKKVIAQALSLWTLQPTIIALKDYSQLSLNEAVTKSSYDGFTVTLTPTAAKSLPFTLTYSKSQSGDSQATNKLSERDMHPNSMVNGPCLVLREPLASGRYLYFVTYFSQSEPDYNDTIWSGHISSNIVEFEVER